MHTYLFLRLVEMFNNIVHCISNALLYFRNTYLYKKQPNPQNHYNLNPSCFITELEGVNSPYLSQYISFNASSKNLYLHQNSITMYPPTSTTQSPQPSDKTRFLTFTVFPGKNRWTSLRRQATNFCQVTVCRRDKKKKTNSMNNVIFT